MVLPGCGHSFHLSCFPAGMGVCCICKVQLLESMKLLATTASESIFQQDKCSEKDNDEEITSNHEEEDLDSNPDECELDEFELAASVAKLHQEIFSWGHISGP